MSYDAHITRSRFWFQPVERILEDEWQELLGARPGIAEWLAFEDGVLTAKNPSASQLADMIAIAHDLGANVQGDDGERYLEPGAQPVPTRSSPFHSLFQQRRPAPKFPVPAPLTVGSRVRSPLRGTGTVVQCEPAANHGLGSLTIKFDDDSFQVFSLSAHGLEVEDGEA